MGLPGIEVFTLVSANTRGLQRHVTTKKSPWQPLSWRDLVIPSLPPLVASLRPKVAKGATPLIYRSADRQPAKLQPAQVDRQGIWRPLIAMGAFWECLRVRTVLFGGFLCFRFACLATTFAGEELESRGVRRSSRWARTHASMVPSCL